VKLKLSRIVFYVSEALHLLGEVAELVKLDRRKPESPVIAITPEKSGESMAIEQRGQGRTLELSDFTPDAITVFTPSALGTGWRNVNALAAYRLQAFLKLIPFRWTITSAWRSDVKNASVGGQADSKHLTGEAFDVQIEDPSFFTAERLSGYVDKARRSGFNGIGLYQLNPVIHVDVRPEPGSWAKVIQGGKQVFTDIASFIGRFASPVTIATAAAAIAAGVFLLAILSRRS